MQKSHRLSTRTAEFVRELESFPVRTSHVDAPDNGRTRRHPRFGSCASGTPMPTSRVVLLNYEDKRMSDGKSYLGPIEFFVARTAP